MDAQFSLFLTLRSPPRGRHWLPLRPLMSGHIRGRSPAAKVGLASVQSPAASVPASAFQISSTWTRFVILPTLASPFFLALLALPRQSPSPKPGGVATRRSKKPRSVYDKKYEDANLPARRKAKREAEARRRAKIKKERVDTELRSDARKNKVDKLAKSNKQLKKDKEDADSKYLELKDELAKGLLGGIIKVGGFFLASCSPLLSSPCGSVRWPLTRIVLRLRASRWLSSTTWHPSCGWSS